MFDVINTQSIKNVYCVYGQYSNKKKIKNLGKVNNAFLSQTRLITLSRGEIWAIVSLYVNDTIQASICYMPVTLFERK